MHKCFLLLVVTLSILVSVDARSAPAARFDIQESKSSLSSIQTDKRSLRGAESTNSAAEEERGVRTVIAKAIKKIESWATEVTLRSDVKALLKKRGGGGR
ncbi:hypothetical protein PHYSODRAFT_288974 [Phytophthora sojae]|uniref:RxLR effector protein n=2 Tax=Phytophthora sojae TaxID=67593 RepID=G5ABI8_PHYSP|nr:hypothetical protein PHYSODRAFT_288974 [Phytophthora sojae]AEK81273.1 Avh374 [Phytophthora sojae]AEK81274.1 Avh374 [Phytophthora sojae]AEK81275.1 Avh374 [Phytophthora sojae]EGZ06713.1 hypothetical protein PHYSODRAFT_288974 [Phytophthora sojae]|eukprot:XP_009537477.1 hypothetical protein PHYSODRAFT_288974 [Phytophthora sojae]